MSDYRICSAYDEFVQDEHFFDQQLNRTDSQKQNQESRPTESIDSLSKSKPKAIVARRQSQRNAKPKQQLSDHYYYYPKRSTNINSKIPDNGGVKSRVHATRMSSKNCHDQASQHTNDSKAQVKSSNTKQRTDSDLNTKLNKLLSDISEESNVSQHSAEITTKNIGATKDNNLTSTIENAVNYHRSGLPSAPSKRSRKNEGAESQ